MPTFSTAFITVAKSNASYFPESSSNDLLIGTFNDTQRILLGPANYPSLMQISNSNVTIGGMFEADMVAVGGQIIGTGSEVIFSPINPNWQIIDQTEGTGIGIGQQRVHLNNAFLQWGNTTIMELNDNQQFSSSSSPHDLTFTYNNLTNVDETTHSKSYVNVTGKIISSDFVISNDSKLFLLAGPTGLFTFGFDNISSDLGESDESLVFRCYYNKKTITTTPQNYYLLKGSQFVTALLPSYSTLIIKFYTEDNPGKSFTLTPGLIFRITRLSVIES